MKTIDNAVREAMFERRQEKLRDHFAGLALQGLLANPAVWTAGNVLPNDYAAEAYRLADAMLAARGEQ